jgi:GUN4-like
LEGLRRQSILRDLETYLARRVPELHRSAGRATRKQVPLVIPEPGWKYEEPILSHYVAAVSVSRLKEMAIDAESDHDLEKAIQIWEQVNLLAVDTGDRQRALNKIRDLTARFKPTEAIDELPPAEPNRISVEFWPHPQNPIDTISFESEKDANYLHLRDLLKAQNWYAADQETLKVMVKATIRGGSGWLDSYNHREFPCKDLQTIDRLWVIASNGQFGFSVQKEIYVHCGGKLDEGWVSDEVWGKFGDAVGWRINEVWQKSYPDLKIPLSPPKIGFFPWGPFGFFEQWRGCNPNTNFASLVSRLMNCREELLANRIG